MGQRMIRGMAVAIVLAMMGAHAGAQTGDPAGASEDAGASRLDRFNDALADTSLHHDGTISDQVYCLGNWAAWTNALERDVNVEGLPDALLKDSAAAQLDNWSVKARLSLAVEGRRADYRDLLFSATHSAATQLAVVGEDSFLGELGACYAREVAVSTSGHDEGGLNILHKGEFSDRVMTEARPVILAIAPDGLASRRLLSKDLGRVAPQYPEALFLLADPADLGEAATDMKLERFPVLIVMTGGEETARTTALYDSRGYAEWVGARLSQPAAPE